MAKADAGDCAGLGQDAPGIRPFFVMCEVCKMRHGTLGLGAGKTGGYGICQFSRTLEALAGLCRDALELGLFMGCEVCELRHGTWGLGMGETGGYSIC